MASEKTPMENANKLGYKCFPDCQYFPQNVTNLNGTVEYTYKDDTLIKYRADKSFNFKCLYDGHIISDWHDNNCPMGRGSKS